MGCSELCPVRGVSPVAQPPNSLSRAMFVFGINPVRGFLLPELQLPENQAALLRPDTVLIDRLSAQSSVPKPLV